MENRKNKQTTLSILACKSASYRTNMRDEPSKSPLEQRNVKMDDKAAALFLCGEVGFMSEGVSGFCSLVGGGDGKDSTGGGELLSVGGGYDSTGGGELLSVGGGDGLDSKGGGELLYLLRLSAITITTNFSFLWQWSSLPLMK